MTISEVQALLLLYRAATPELRARAARLVPELVEWDAAQPAPEPITVSPSNPDISYDRDVPPPFVCPIQAESCGDFWKRFTPDDPNNSSFIWAKLCSDAACPLNAPRTA